MDTNRRKNAQKVVVAMSGGVDSSVAAALLKRDGFEVVGVFMKFWSEPEKKGLVVKENRCCSQESEKRARKVAHILGIPFYIFNFEREFKKRIVDCFLKEHKKGRTPNPCVICNKEIKFGLLLEKALSLNADFVATGHYVKKSEKKRNETEYGLLKGKDKEKDQSYFLWQLSQRQLKHILFPVGDYKKNQVRKMAKNFKLPVFNTPESMEICFIPAEINDFLKKYLKEKPGDIIDRTGKIIGKHMGLCFYTIGQRKGIGLSGGPYYVAEKDLKNNILIVSKNKKDLVRKDFITEKINWISGKKPKLPIKVKAKIRSRHIPASATVKLSDKKIKVIFDKPQRAITSGQSVVFYNGRELLGGGIIK